MEYEAVIGLETHVQLKTRTKMWCGCANEFGAGVDNVPPIANEGQVITDEDISVDIELTGSDMDNDALTFTIVDQTTYGELIGDAPNIIYTSNTNWFGEDSFTYIV